MKEIVEKLHENRQVELAKSILESAGYKVTKKMNESAESDDKFKVGDKVSFSMLYGGRVYAEVVKISGDKLTLREKWVAEDTGDEASADTDYDIHTNDKGVEYIVTWEYHGHEGVAYPPHSQYVY